MKPFLFTVLLTWIVFSTAAVADTYDVKLAPYNAYGDGVHDDFEAIQDAVNDAIADGPGNTVLIPAGTYLLGYNEVVNISNTTGLTVQGQAGAKIINGNSDNGVDDFSINNSSNVTLDTLTLDVQTLRSTQGRVTALSADGKTVTLTLDATAQSLSASIFSGISSTHALDCFFWTDPNSLMFDQNEGGPGDIAVQPTLVSGSSWTVVLNTAVSTDVIGKQVGILNEGGSWGIGVYDCTGQVTLSNITDFGGGGSGAAVGMDRNLGPVTISHFVIGPPPGSGRLFASAGGFDYQGNRGQLTVQNCDICRTKDDLIDCGTDLAHILAHPSGNVVQVENTANYYVGDSVQIWDWTENYQTVRSTATITGVVHNGDGTWTLTLNQAVTVVNVGPGPGDGNSGAQADDGIDRVCDVNNAGPCMVTNNRIQTSGRAFNFKAANSTISNNYFYQIGWCINATAETFFHGGPTSLNLIVANNTFSDIGWQAVNLEIGGSYANTGIANVTIKNNQFNNCGAHEAFSDGLFPPLCDIRGGGIRLTSTVGATISGNTFVDNWGPPIAVQNSSNVQISNNTILGAGKHTWSDKNNYYSYGVHIDMGSDIWLDNASNITLSNNIIDALGTYNSSAVVATSTCSAITGQTTGYTIGGATLSSAATSARQEWYKADAITGLANGAAVNTWSDSSGLGHSATKVTNAPTYVTNSLNGKPVVHFNAASSQYLSLARSIQDDFTILCVFRSTQGLNTGTDFYVGAGLVNAEVGGVTNDFGTSLNANGAVLAGTGNPDTTAVSPNGYNDGQPHLMIFRRTKSTGLGQLYVDGVLVNQFNAGTQSLTSPTQVVLGAQQTINNFLTGDIAEVQIFNIALTDADRFNLQQSMAGRWGLGLSSVAATARQEWYKADAITGLANGAAVNTWSDSSGLGHSATKVTNAPTYVTNSLNGNPVVHFTSASSQYLSLARSIQDNFTIMCVFRSTQGISTGTNFWDGAGLVSAEVPGTVNDFGTCLNANGQIGAGTGNPDTTAGSPTGYNDGLPHVLTMKRLESSGYVGLSVDGQLVGVVMAGGQTLTSPSQVVLGAQQTVSNFLQGDIAEVEIFNTYLSEPDQQAAEHALISKWGVANP